MLRLGALLLLVLICGCTVVHTTAKTPRLFRPPAAVQNDIAVYFSPDGGAMAAILSEIDRARRTVDVNAYLITAPEIADSLKAAAKRGVTVRIILDKNNIGGIYSKAFFP